MNPRRIAFLIGAGASLGAGHILPVSPPLGSDLYDKLASQFPDSWGPRGRIGQMYADGLRRDFEATVFNEVCMREPAINVLEWNRDMAHFFAQFTLDGTGCDLYTRLLDFLQTSDNLANTSFTSLNYDCLLEQAATARGMNVVYCGPHDGGADVRILKIHGSCHFITEDLSRLTYLLTNSGSGLECGFEILSTRNLRQTLQSKFLSQRSGFYPVFSLYAFGKNTPVATVKIQEIRNAWLEEAEHATHLIVIGVRCNRDDHHITDGLKGTDARRILYVGGTKDFADWHSLNPYCQHLGERFDQSFDAICDGVLRNP